MSTGAEFYAAKVAEYGDDCKTMALAFESAVLRGDREDAKDCLRRLIERSERASSHAEMALSKLTTEVQS